MVFSVFRQGDKHKYIRQLKKFLNELVVPNPNLSDDEVLDEKTLKAVKSFKMQWYARVGMNLKTDDPYFEVNFKVWTVLGLAVGKEKLVQTLRNTQDYELRNLLMGMGTVNSMSVLDTNEMEKCDAKVASVFGGKNAIAAANGFEPYSLAIVRKHFYYDGHLTSMTVI